MATIAELEAQLGNAKARLADVARQVAAALTQLGALGDESRALLRAGQDEAARAKSAEALQYKNQVYRPLATQESQLESEVAALERAIQAARTQTTAAADAGPRTASAGDVVGGAATARDDAANSQIPEPRPDAIDAEGRISPRPPITSPSNAQTTEANNQPDSGTNEPIRRAETTQSISIEDAPGQPGEPLPNTPALTTDGAGGSTGSQQPNITSAVIPGTAAAPDDNTSATVTDTTGAANAVQSAINRRFGAPIESRPNILDQYASYTYTISIYLMSAADYNRMIQTKSRILSGAQLLMQSGGAPNSTQSRTPQTNAAGAITGGEVSTAPGGRNQFFPLDYYIESLRMKSFIMGKGTKGAHNAVEMEFRIIEPNGITLFENLYRAVQAYTASNPSPEQAAQNYAAQHYLMVIRFYGYDINGNLQPPASVDATGTTDRFAISEKFIPFKFTGIKFRIANRLTEYQCTAVCPQYDIAQGQARGVVPYNVEFTATTLKNLLTGAAEFADSSQPPPDAGSAPRPNLVNGLTEALNRFQQELVNKGVIGVADEYRIVLVEPELQNAKIRPPGKLDKGSVGAIDTSTPRQALDGTTQAVDTSSRGFGAVAGMPIVQFIDLAVRNSTYIYDQQTKIVDPETGASTAQGGAQTPAWYRVGVQVEQLAYDPVRNDYAYRITYQVNMYKVSLIKSDYFPNGKFVGTQKKYNYWFTGENTAILRFEQDFNYLYYITVNTFQPVNPITGTFTSDYREFEKRAFAPRSPQASQGAAGTVNEPGANGADFLYSPGDQGQVRIEIVGDPAWIQQGDVWSGIGGVGVSDPASVAFLPDGTINFESQEALFEIAFNKPADYNLATGLMDIPRRQ